ncbi:MAG: glutamine-hydrolyzing carbamoyl-phosphate synthase small subunit [Steroidobacteraceae bacterium]
MKNETKFRLELEDGTVARGTGFGAMRPVAGEVVFNTGMAGYVESLTDPSYRGQILVLTYPLIGSYGVPAPRPSDSLAGPFESGRIQVQGLVVQHYVATPSHHASRRSLGEWLNDEEIPAVSGIDTRTLTRRLREFGTMRGWLAPDAMAVADVRELADQRDMRSGIFYEVAPAEVRRYEGGSLEVLVVDAGTKDNIVRSLLARGASVTRAPWHCDLAPLAARADGIVIGNGPGDPKDLGPLIAQIRALLGRHRRPIFGVCLGNQILCLAAGGDTYKLPYGHRGVNQPVRDLRTGRCYVTSQNHGYAVREEALPAGWQPWFVNINDGSNEGIRSVDDPYFSVQFHPEASPGPQDTAFLFDDFLRLAGELKA